MACVEDQGTRQPCFQKDAWHRSVSKRMGSQMHLRIRRRTHQRHHVAWEHEQRKGQPRSSRLGGTRTVGLTCDADNLRSESTSIVMDGTKRRMGRLDVRMEHHHAIALERRRNRNLVRKIKYRKLLEKEGWTTRAQEHEATKKGSDDEEGPASSSGRKTNPSMEKTHERTQESDDEDPNHLLESTDQHPSRNKRKREAENNTMQKLYEKATRQKRAKRELLEEQERKKNERREQREAAAARRKRRTADMRKVNRKGQPLMKSRMEGILDKLAKDA